MSRLDDILTLIEARYADPSVSFECGKLVLNKHAQRRKVILVRQEGTLTFSSAPGRAPFSVPVDGVGTTTKQRFERFELLEATIRAEDESELDIIFDRLVNAIFEVFGPNAFENTNQYEWFQGDSTNGGDWARRNPAIKLYIRVRLKSRSQPGPYAVLATADATLILKDSEGATGPTGEFVNIDT
jgi:hypothetical protein